ncbi:MAG: hypothetical protein KDD73_08160 [Anaerolineales bacterium]|nr:hypothetical protein [Anaerolineales bacterium]MCB9126817.1 hypothetical protein [Ardenticatenales bacterium]
MAATCIECGKAITGQDYRLIGVEQGSWASRYAHRGECEQAARDRLTPKPSRTKRSARRSSTPVVEELILEDELPPATDDSASEESLPWFGTQRRR